MEETVSVCRVPAIAVVAVETEGGLCSRFAWQPIVCTVLSVEDDGCEYDCGTGVGRTTRDVEPHGEHDSWCFGSAIQSKERRVKEGWSMCGYVG